MYNKQINITFDPAKDSRNLSKHHMSLAEAAKLEWHTLWAKQDIRHDYGEARMVGYAYIGLRLFCVVYVDRDEVHHIISLRKANLREVNQYAKA